MKELPVRKDIRLKNYDYSRSGYYFITICTQNRIDWLGKIVVGQGFYSCRLSDAGIITETELIRLEARYKNLKIDKYTIMPNHVHIIILNEDCQIRDGKDEICQTPKRQEQSPRPTMMDAVCSFKSITAKAFNKENATIGKVLWQSRFHDHIIRNEAEYCKIWQYIDENPLRWTEDCYYEP